MREGLATGLPMRVTGLLLVYLAAAWMAGLAAAAHVSLPPAAWALWLVVPLGLLLIWRGDPALVRVHLCLLMFVLAALRYTAALPAFDDKSLAALNDRGAVALVGVVVDPPRVRDRVTDVRLAVTDARVAREWREATGLALVQVPRETDVRYGDRIQVYGEPATPAEFADFSYKDYLARQGIHSVVRVYGSVTILASDQGNMFLAALYAVRARALDVIHAIFPEPAASLLAGILLGDDAGLPRELDDAFAATNTSHVIAISGFNTAIVAGILSALLQRVSRRRAVTMLGVVLGLAAYTLLVGASASVVRAAVMGGLSAIALYLYRRNIALNALAFAALVMTLHNPFALFDLGFQLSFLATLGLILYVPPLTEWSERWLGLWLPAEQVRRVVGAFGDTVLVTLAAQITTLPLILFVFHRFSPVGLFANFLILPAQPAVMILGGIATLVAMIVQPVGQLLAWVAWPFLEWTILVVQAFASLPFASIDVGRLEAPIVFASYAAILGGPNVDWNALKKGVGLRPAVLMGIVLVVGIWGWNVAQTAPDGKTHIEFLDAGGPATFVRTPRGSRVLIDGGAEPSVVLAALGERMPFWDRSLDLVVLTNTSDDHLAGLVAVLERYDVRQVVQVDAPAKSMAAHTKWAELIAGKRVASMPAQPGVQIAVDRDVALEILDLSEPMPPVVRLRAGALSVLFAEGLSVDEQEELADSGLDLTSTLLVAPRKLAPELLDAVSPQMAVLFVGRGERDKPSADLLEMLSGITVLRTDERGSIVLVVEKDRVGVRARR